MSLGLMSEPPQCCICQDALSGPTSLPCGHRFCLVCIGEYWRHAACQCPLCKTVFSRRPHLKRDQTPPSPSEAVPLKAGEVPCDLCPVKRPAVKACLQCLASYCSSHLELHYQTEDLGRHQLISVVKNLEDSVCRLHGKKLEMFCKSDRACICSKCTQTEHRGHRIVSISREATKKKSILRRRRSKVQQQIHDRQSQVAELKLSDDLGGETPPAAQTQNNKLIGRLEEEICELQEKNQELEQLLQSEDHLRFIQVSTVSESQQAS
ncbi:E3 ubiquitin-protein ligase TRIM47 [Nothobranchius furzeri]|uniref:Tripartite motif containing 47 n=2 Tax=Nothobranchius TaxID=28779 RepID=A0A1A8A1D6_NOTFU|nr:tripartite motif-containing protein 47-like [Nothobranchius furzeri]